MFWSYKTVQYGLKKEGLLSSSFLDETEVEQSLNEFGQAGWELVSLFAMQDGLMAVFKQPLDTRPAPIIVHEPEIESQPDIQEKTERRRVIMNSDETPISNTVHERKINRREPMVSMGEEQKNEKEEGVGGIRIE